MRNHSARLAKLLKLARAARQPWRLELGLRPVNYRADIDQAISAAPDSFPVVWIEIGPMESQSLTEGEGE